MSFITYLMASRVALDAAFAEIRKDFEKYLREKSDADPRYRKAEELFRNRCPLTAYDDPQIAKIYIEILTYRQSIEGTIWDSHGAILIDFLESRPPNDLMILALIALGTISMSVGDSKAIDLLERMIFDHGHDISVRKEALAALRLVDKHFSKWDYLRRVADLGTKERSS